MKTLITCVSILFVAAVFTIVGCSQDQLDTLNRAGDTVIRTSAAASQPVNLVLPAQNGQPGASISVSTGVFGTAAATLGAALGLLLKTLAGSLPKKETK